MSQPQSSEQELLTQLAYLDKQIEGYEKTLKSINTSIKRLKEQRANLYTKYTISQIKKNQVADWLENNYIWSQKVNHELKNRFKFDSFRPSQLGAINASLHEKDVLVVMPTGGGKSLIYQLVAVIKGKLTVVISPLLALIDDQINSLSKFDITAGSINSSMTRAEKTEILNKMKRKQLQIIFVTPELIAKSSLFMNNLSKLHKEKYISQFVIDEVHCCSQWGHDFRTDYKSLSLLKTQFSTVPILGLTATATMPVLIDIKSMLCLPNPVIITAPFNRPNLFFRVVVGKPDHPKVWVEVLIKTKYYGKSGIIYVATQKESEDLADYLREEHLRVAPYHAGLRIKSKNSNQKKWFQDQYNVMVATIAFGMGIDKPDVKYIIHYSVPKSIEALYQESGRAGRNGEDAECTLIFGLQEWLKTFAQSKTAVEEKNTFNVLGYCLDLTTCRRTLLSKYFDEDCVCTDECNKMCDNCRIENKTIQLYNIQPCLRDLLAIMVKADQLEINVTLRKLMENWYCSAPKGLKHTAPKFPKDYGEYIIGYLIHKKYLRVRRGYNLATSYAIIYSELDEVPLNSIRMPFNDNLEGLNVLKDECAPSTSGYRPSCSAPKEEVPAKKLRSK